MSFIRFRPKRSVMAVAIATQLSYGAALAVPTLFSSQAVAQNAAVTQQKIKFDIAPGQLTEVLNQFAKTSGVYLSADAVLTRGKNSAGLKGIYSVQDALAQLLQGAEIQAQWKDGQTVNLRKMSKQELQELVPVTVIERSIDERALGPVAGMIALRSASGTKTDTALIETPQAVSVITQDQILLQGLETPSQALRYTPGVMAELFGNDSRFDWISVRGFAVREYLDGMALPRGSYAWPRMEMYGLNRAEILRGPASVLYGSTPPGGLYNFVSKRPEEEAQSEIQVQVGSPQRAQASFDFTGPLTDDGSVLYRVTGLGREADTLVDHVENDRKFIQPSLTWKPSDRTSLTAQGYFIEDQSKSLQFLPREGTLYVNPNGTLSRSTFTGEPDFDRFEREQTGIGYHLEHEFTNGWMLNHKLRKSEGDILLKGMRPNFGWVDNDRDGEPDDYRTHNRAAFIFDETAEALTADTNVLISIDQGDINHSVLAGFDYRKSDADYKAGYGYGTPLDLYNPVYDLAPVSDPDFFVSTVQEQKQLGIYLQDQIEIDQLQLMLSVRHDTTDTDTTDRMASSSDSFDDDAFTYRIGALYSLQSGLAPFVSYSTSFTPNLSVDEQGNAFDATTGEQLEAGVKYLSADQSKMVTLSVYDLKQKDVVLNNPITSFKEQVGEVAVKCIELEAKMELDNGLNLLASYSYTDAELSQHNNPVYQGNRLHNVPETQASIWGDYRFHSSILDGVRAGLGVRYVGSHYGDAGNTVLVSGKTLTDMVISYDLKALAEGATVSLNVSNLFDKEFLANCDETSCYWGEGRVVKGTFAYRW